MDEVAVSVTLEIPDQMFRKPQINATIRIPDEAATPHEIEAGVLDNVKEAIETSTGLQVVLTIQKNDNE